MKKNGISLIVLIVTIIVIIILAAVVILTVSKNNPIDSAKEARFKEDVRTFQDELAMTLSKLYTTFGGNRDGKITTSDFDEIKEYIPSFSEKYKGKFVIDDDELKYAKLSDKEINWCENMYIENGVPYTELEYIESTGTQFIDTDLLDTEGWKIDMSYEFTKFGDSKNSGWTQIFGTCAIYGGTVYRSYLSLCGSFWHLDVYSNYSGNPSIQVSLNKKYRIEASTFSENSYLIVDGELLKEVNIKYNSHEFYAYSLYFFASQSKDFSNTSARKIILL